MRYSTNLTSASLAAEVIIQDTEIAFIPADKIPRQDLINEAKTSKPKGIQRYWVQGVLLANISKSMYEEIDVNVNGVVGNTFGFGGKVYNNQTSASKDYKISLQLIDIDAYDEHAAQLRTSVAFERNKPVVMPGSLAIYGVEGLKEKFEIQP